MDAHLPVVIANTKSFMRRHVPAGSLVSLCEQKLAFFEEQVLKQGMAPCVDVPYHLCHGFSQNTKKSQMVGLVSTCIYLGCDILDDLHDNELGPVQKQYSPAHVSLAGSLLLSTVPILAIGEFFDAADTRSHAACQVMAESFLKMAHGQVSDIQSRFNADFSVAEIESNVIAKSGEEMALFCNLAALAADQDIPTQQTCTQFGRDLATALQIISDLTDLFEETVSNDLQQGTLTIPLALHLLGLEKAEKSLFCKLWRQSSHDPEARRLLQAALRESGALAHTALMIESYCDKARKTLESLPLQKKSWENLAVLIEKASRYAFFHLQSFVKKSSDFQITNTLMGM